MTTPPLSPTRPSSSRPLVCVIDDDESVRDALPALLRAVGYAAEAFATAEDYLASPVRDRAACLVVDLWMPGMGGRGLQRVLTAAATDTPIVFITARAEPEECRRVIEDGAVACLIKPFGEDQLLGALRTVVPLAAR